MGPGVTAIVEYVVVVGVAVDVRVPGGESVVRPGWARAEDRREAITGVSCLESMQSHLALSGPRIH